MKKRVLSIVCTLAILIGSIGLSSYAVASDTVCTIGTTEYANEYYFGDILKTSALSKAIADYQAGQVIQLHQNVDSTKSVTITNDTYIDLNGYKLSHKITVNAGCTLYLMDSKTDSFSTTAATCGKLDTSKVTLKSNAKYMAVPAGAGVANGHNDAYWMVEDTSAKTASFHRFSFACVVYGPFVHYEMAFDSVIGASISEYGVGVGTTEASAKADLMINVSTKGTKINNKNNISLQQWLLTEDDHIQQVYQSQRDVDIYAYAYYIKNGVKEEISHSKTCNLKKDMEQLSANWDNATEWEKVGAYKLFMDNADLMRYWKLSNIRRSGLCNWTNVLDTGVIDGKIHYYFMYSDNIYYDDTNMIDGVGNKWGDCCLIVLPDGTTMLVDTGRYEYLPTLITNLRLMGVKKIDHLIISHGDPDHIGGVTNYNTVGTAKGGPANYYNGGLADYFEIGTVYYPDMSENSYVKDKAAIYLNENMVKYFAKKGIDKSQLKAVKQGGQPIQITEDVTMRVLWPTAAGTAGVSGNVQNDNSMVFRLDCGEHSSLFTGDIYRADTDTYASGAELDVIGLYGPNGTAEANLLNVDLLKVPHHGQNTSSGDNKNSDLTDTSTNFVAAVAAKYAVATGYSDPSLNATGNVDNRYSAVKTTLLRDFNLGYIHVAVNPTTDAFDTPDTYMPE